MYIQACYISNESCFSEEFNGVIYNYVAQSVKKFYER